MSAPSSLITLPADWQLQQEDGHHSLYANTAGDYLSLHYFPVVPDIDADLTDSDSLRAFYRRITARINGAMLEVDAAQLAGLPAVCALLKLKVESGELAFVGSYTLPFADCSYVIKVESKEAGPTGMREAAVLAQMSPELSGDGKVAGWEQDPYAPDHKSAFMCNKSDDPQYDHLFPEHPLSKVRRYLAQLQDDIALDASLHALAPFKRAPQPMTDQIEQYSSAWQHFKALLRGLGKKR